MIDQALRAAVTLARNDAMARSMLAKQIFNGVRIYLNGAKMLSDNATPRALSRDNGNGGGA